jgi:hypothetical protein
MTAKIICAWCGITLGIEQWEGNSKTEVISHGICGHCYAAQTKALDQGGRAVENIQKGK